MIQVVLNADDFGFTEGVCAGIVRAIQAGGLTATTAMACAPGSLERLARWAPLVPERIGAHLQLTSGRPILPAGRIPSLVDENGMFPAKRKALRNPRREEILAEWLAQMEALLKAGVRPTHVDSHHHVHRLPPAFEAIAEIAVRYGIPARPAEPDMVPQLRARGAASVDRLLTGWYGGELTVESLRQLLVEGTGDLAAPAVVEVMCHPGFVDEELRAVSGYVEDRETELVALCDHRLVETLAAAGFALCGFPALGETRAAGHAKREVDAQAC